MPSPRPGSIANECADFLVLTACSKSQLAAHFNRVALWLSWQEDEQPLQFHAVDCKQPRCFFDAHKGPE